MKERIEKKVAKLSVGFLFGLGAVSQLITRAETISNYERRIRAVVGSVGYHTAHIGIPVAEAVTIAALGYVTVKSVAPILDRFVYTPRKE